VVQAPKGHTSSSPFSKHTLRGWSPNNEQTYPTKIGKLATPSGTKRRAHHGGAWQVRDF